MSKKFPEFSAKGTTLEDVGRDFIYGDTSSYKMHDRSNFDSDVHFNSNERSGRYRVALHEFGHVLGDHPDDHGQFVNAIMNSKTDDNGPVNGRLIARAKYGGGSSRGQPDPTVGILDPVRQGRASTLTANARPGFVNDVGAQYGRRGAGGPDPDYTTVGLHEGVCAMWAEYRLTCAKRGGLTPLDCPAGKGDCDSNSECQAGLTCVNDVGAHMA